MTKIIDWEYYCSHFPNFVPAEQFEAIENQAEIEYRNVVKPYMNIPTVNEQNCIFKLCNFLYTNSSSMAGKRVTAVSNNGYSESYSMQTSEDIAHEMRELMYECIGTRLAGAF